MLVVMASGFRMMRLVSESAVLAVLVSESVGLVSGRGFRISPF